MKLYLFSVFMLIAFCTALSGFAPGGWDVLLPKILEFAMRYI